LALSNPHLIASWAVAVAEALEARGLDSRALFAEAGIDIKTTRDPRSRIQADEMTLVYSLIDKITGDASFGLDIARHVHPTTFHALGYSLFASRTMESFCNRLVRFFRLVTTNAVTEFTQTRGEYQLLLNPTVGRDSYIPQDAWLATIVKFARDVYRADYTPVRVSLRRPDPAGAASRFKDYFGAPVEFGCGVNALIFDARDIHAQLPAANAELARQNDEVVMSLLAQLDRNDILARVRAKFVELLPSGDCSKNEVAKRLNMSERTLQHKLNDRHTSYRELLNEMRQEFAVQYLSQGVHSVSEVAYLLGFSEISSFSRAFRAWIGESPSEYRERRLKGD